MPSATSTVSPAMAQLSAYHACMAPGTASRISFARGARARPYKIMDSGSPWVTPSSERMTEHAPPARRTQNEGSCYVWTNSDIRILGSDTIQCDTDMLQCDSVTKRQGYSIRYYNYIIHRGEPPPRGRSRPRKVRGAMQGVSQYRENIKNEYSVLNLSSK